MKSIYIFRIPHGDQGTGGILFCPTTGFECRSIELPWRDNNVSISCIPKGTYMVEPFKSPKYGNTYIIKDVPGRSYILFHWGNWAGDKSKGFKSNSEGCILLGTKHGYLTNQFAVLNSRTTVKRFLHTMNNEPFKLTII